MRTSLYFLSAREIVIKEERIPKPTSRQVLVQSLVSVISSGTELLVYRDQVPRDLPLDETIPLFGVDFKYPLKYGYSVVGKVIDCGDKVSPEWEDRIVFSFHPHESHFVSSPNELIPVPYDISHEEAAFLPNVETAVNLILEGQPLIGEKVVILGQGVVGLLTTAILSNFPLSCLLTLDKYSLRREKSLEVGAHYSSSPTDLTTEILQNMGFTKLKADLTYELSGDPSALENAIQLTGYAGRVIIGSWYGTKISEVHLGGKFHRERIRLESSQVSTIDPRLSGRWDKTRRIQLAFDMIKGIRPSHLITQRFPINQADQAYSLIDKRPEKTIQVLLTY